MVERKINLSPALLGKAIDAIGIDGITRLHEHYVTIVDPDRLAALERLYEASQRRDDAVNLLMIATGVSRDDERVRKYRDDEMNAHMEIMNILAEIERMEAEEK